MTQLRKASGGRAWGNSKCKSVGKIYILRLGVSCKKCLILLYFPGIAMHLYIYQTRAQEKRFIRRTIVVFNFHELNSIN